MREVAQLRFAAPGLVRVVAQLRVAAPGLARVVAHGSYSYHLGCVRKTATVTARIAT